MSAARRKFRKRPYQPPRDGTVLASILREISELIQHRDFAGALSRANQLLSTPGLSPHKQSRVLSLVADSEYKRGAFDEATRIYQQAATLCLDHHTLWLRPLVGQVKALLKAIRVDEALMMARHTHDVTRHKREAFNAQVRTANRELAEHGSVIVPPLPPRVSVVATRMGYLFLQDGELEAAREFFEKALEASSHGACRARQGLAQIALAMDDPARALTLSAECIRIGNYAAKTIPSWSTLIAARRKLGGWQISENLLKGLEKAPPSVRARAVLIIVRELRKSDMRQWRKIALQWSSREGQEFPIIEAEIRKMVLASAKTMPGDATGKRELAEQLLRTPGLSPSEWLAAAKEVVRAGLWEGSGVNIEQLLTLAAARYGQDFTPQVVHSLALSCMMAKRHDLARPLLQRNTTQLSHDSTTWAKSVWALARMESLLGNHATAAGLYRQFFEEESIPVRFRLQAQLLWAEALIAVGQPNALLEARSTITATLRGVQDSEIIMNFARQLAETSPALEDWSEALFAQGSALALRQFQEAGHPSLATDLLFKLTRRQVYDFGQSAEAIRFWESLDEKKRAWLWSTRDSFWQYLGLILEAYGLEGRSDQVRSFAHFWIEDPATPPEGRVQIGIPYGRWLVNYRHVSEALNLFDRLIRESPTHSLCALAWYWKALEAHKRGDYSERNRCIVCLRLAQGAQGDLPRERDLGGKALLLLADLDTNRVDEQGVNFRPADFKNFRARIINDLSLLP